MEKKIDGIPIKEGTLNDVDLDAFQKQIDEARRQIKETQEREALAAAEAAAKAKALREAEVEEDDIEYIEEEEAEEIKKEKRTTYTDVINEMPELKDDLDYLLITKKIKNGEQLSKKEETFKMIYEQAKRKEQDFIEATNQKMIEEEERQKGLQELINKEYEEYRTRHPETIERHDENSLTLKGSENFLKIALTFLALKKSKKKGGKIFIKVARPKKVSIEWTTKDIRFVEFWSTNERGDKIKEVSRVSQYNYTFEGTSIPVVFAIQGFAEAWDFYNEFKKDLSSEAVSGMIMEAYNTGLKDGLVLKDKDKNKDPFGFLTPFLPIIIIGGFLIMIYLLWQNYQATTDMLAQVQQIHAASVPIDVNSVVIQ